MTDTPWLPKPKPWMPHDYDEAAVMSVRALAAGVANEGQQKTVWDYLMYLTAASPEYYDLAYRPGTEGERDTSFALGKQFVGLQIRKLLNPTLTPKTAEEVAADLPRRVLAQRARRQRERMIRNGDSQG